jgi:hypothetical protein
MKRRQIREGATPVGFDSASLDEDAGAFGLLSKRQQADGEEGVARTCDRLVGAKVQSSRWWRRADGSGCGK